MNVGDKGLIARRKKAFSISITAFSAKTGMVQVVDNYNLVTMCDRISNLSEQEVNVLCRKVEKVLSP